MSFFFVRQAAKAHAIGSASYQRPPRLRVRADEPRLARFFRERRLPGIELRGDRAQIAFSPRKVRGAFTCVLGTLRTDAECAAFLPFPGEPVPPIELVPAGSEALPWRKGAALFQLLEQSGFAPVVTRARGRFVSERLLEAFRAATRDAPPAQVRADLLRFGFRLPAGLSLGSRKGRKQKGLARRVAHALAAEAIAALDDGTLAHPSQADLLAHLLFGFPVVRGGLLRWAAAGTSPVARSARRVLGQR
jgi:hypothetical protein